MHEKLTIDIETTGLSNQDEILQLSVLDTMTDEVLFNSFLKPSHIKSWDEATKTHHITPEMVVNAPTINQIRDAVQKLLDKASLIVGYNHLNFDNRFLAKAGFRLPERQYDVMLKYSEYIKEPNKYPEGFNKTPYKWFKLVDCATNLGYDWESRPHDSASDARATSWCYRKLTEIN